MSGFSSTARFKKRQRLMLASAGVGVMAVMAILLWQGLGKDSLSLFVQPSDIQARKLENGSRIRLGGLVVPGSVHIDQQSGYARFAITDCKAQIQVVYNNILPDLFREGQEVVTEGILQTATSLQASNVLAKHDENYAPPGVLVRGDDGCKARTNALAVGAISAEPS